MAQIKEAKFYKSYLKPKYWLIWLGVGLFRLILMLPYPVLVRIGRLLGKLFKTLPVGKRRIEVARQNLRLCFPDFTDTRIEEIVHENIQETGMGIIETGMAWFWSDKRIRKWSKVEDVEILKRERGKILIGVHFLTLELGARIVGLHHPGVGVYRPHDNPVMDYIQLKGRLRSNKGMLTRSDLRGMIRALRDGNMIWYAPDHDYGPKNSIFVPFFAVEKAATTTGSYYLMRASNRTKALPFAPLRNKDNSGYTLNFSEDVDFSDIVNDEEAVCTRMNEVIEKEIEKDITQYMWLHRRFKTRPEGEGSIYKGIAER